MREAGSLTDVPRARGRSSIRSSRRPMRCARIVTEAVEDAAADGAALSRAALRPGDPRAARLELDAGHRGGVRWARHRASRATGMPAGLVACALRHHDDDDERGSRPRRGRPAPAGASSGSTSPATRLLFPARSQCGRPFAHRRGRRARPDRARRRGRNRRGTSAMRSRCSVCVASGTGSRAAEDSDELIALGGRRGHLLRESARPRTSSPAPRVLRGASDRAVPRRLDATSCRRRRSDDDRPPPRRRFEHLVERGRASGPMPSGGSTDVLDRPRLLRGLHARRAPGRSPRGRRRRTRSARLRARRRRPSVGERADASAAARGAGRSIARRPPCRGPRQTWS